MNDAKRVLHFILSGNYIRFIGARIECGKSDPHLEGCIPTRLKFRVNRYITSGSINKNCPHCPCWVGTVGARARGQC